MDITLYFNPVDFDFFERQERFSRHSLGHFIRKNTQKATFSKKGDIKVVIFGISDESGTLNKGTARAPEMVRKHLYRLSYPEGMRGIVDLGDLKTGKTHADVYFALRDVVEFFKDSGIVAVVLGGGQDLSIGIARAFRDIRDFTLSVVDRRIDMKTSRQVTGSMNFISKLMDENPMLFHLQVIAVQGHLVPGTILEKLRQHTFDCIQLGQLRDDFSIAEPVLRNTSFLSFDISSVRQADAKGYYEPSPNGLYGEEACRISHYAGLSTKISIFGLFEINPDYDFRETTSDLAAQMIWYFLEALIHRSYADPATDLSPFVKYFVDLEGNSLVFYKHPPTNRWWIEIQNEENDNWIVPCRESDYLAAAKEEIPDIWWKFARKTNRLLK
jgi:formiminoglutamase